MGIEHNKMANRRLQWLLGFVMSFYYSTKFF